MGVESLNIHIRCATGARFPLPAAADDDAPPNDVRQYSLDPATPPFRLEQSPPAGELYLVLTGPLDREATSEYALTVTAVDGGSSRRRSATLSVRVLVVDANDHAPTFAQPLYEVAVWAL